MKAFESIKLFLLTRFFSYQISVKGVILFGDKIALLKNERDEWELPGGKLEKHEKYEECVVREIKEELSIDVEIVRFIDCWLYFILNKYKVLIVSYYCRPLASQDSLKCSNEHKELRLFDLREVKSLKMPDGYKRTINKIFRRR
jgi:8-oxo-dGTP pyrophosphatase MutT (NUDIX family)